MVAPATFPTATDPQVEVLADAESALWELFHCDACVDYKDGVSHLCINARLQRRSGCKTPPLSVYPTPSPYTILAPIHG